MTHRRDFIKKSVLGTAGITIGGMGFSAKSYASILGANDRFRIAVCGVNGRGKSHINGFGKQENVEIAYLVDPDSLIRDERINKFREEGILNSSVKVFQMYDAYLMIRILMPSVWQHPIAGIR